MQQFDLMYILQTERLYVSKSFWIGSVNVNDWPQTECNIKSGNCQTDKIVNNKNALACNYRTNETLQNATNISNSNKEDSKQEIG
jgi:hypothetical protein